MRGRTVSFTRGGERKRKEFVWRLDATSETVNIENEKGRKLAYTVGEVREILLALRRQFGADFFPFANNVERLGNGTERPGLGTTMLDLLGHNVAKAQGASYLGVVLEEAGILCWNGRHRGIEWRLEDPDLSRAAVKAKLGWRPRDS